MLTGLVLATCCRLSDQQVQSAAMADAKGLSYMMTPLVAALYVISPQHSLFAYQHLKCTLLVTGMQRCKQFLLQCQDSNAPCFCLLCIASAASRASKTAPVEPLAPLCLALLTACSAAVTSDGDPSSVAYRVQLIQGARSQNKTSSEGITAEVSINCQIADLHNGLRFICHADNLSQSVTKAHSSCLIQHVHASSDDLDAQAICKV